MGGVGVVNSVRGRIRVLLGQRPNGMLSRRLQVTFWDGNQRPASGSCWGIKHRHHRFRLVLFSDHSEFDFLTLTDENFLFKTHEYNAGTEDCLEQV